MSFDEWAVNNQNFKALSQSLWNRAMSFDNGYHGLYIEMKVSQSLWNRAMSFDVYASSMSEAFKRLNPFGTGQCLSTILKMQGVEIEMSQSLWNRAMSFDDKFSTQWNEEEQSQSLWNRAMSFDSKFAVTGSGFQGLNPFGTGQCLSTFIR